MKKKLTLLERIRENLGKPFKGSNKMLTEKHAKTKELHSALNEQLLKERQELNWRRTHKR